MPAAVVDYVTEVASTLAVAFTFLTPATEDQILCLLIAGDTTVAFGTVIIQGDPNRPYLEATATAGDTNGVLRVYQLADGDETIQAPPAVASADTVVAFAVVEGTPFIPTDWDLDVNNAAAASTPRTAAWTALDVGIIIGLAIIDGAAVTIVEPYPWTFMDDSSAAAMSYNFSYGTIAAAGAQPAEIFTGTIPGGLTGQVYWFGVYDLGLRIRDAGAWVNGAAGVFQSSSGTPEPPRRSQPDPEPLPLLPPAPDPIVVPTPPWIPGSGPYRPT